MLDTRFCDFSARVRYSWIGSDSSSHTTWGIVLLDIISEYQSYCECFNVSPALEWFKIVVPVVMTFQGVLVREAFSTHLALKVNSKQ